MKSISNKFWAGNVSICPGLVNADNVLITTHITKHHGLGESSDGSGDELLGNNVGNEANFNAKSFMNTARNNLAWITKGLPTAYSKFVLNFSSSTHLQANS